MRWSRRSVHGDQSCQGDEVDSTTLTHALQDGIVPRHLPLEIRQQRRKVYLSSLLHAEEEMVGAAVVRAALIQVDLASNLPARYQGCGPE